MVEANENIDEVTLRRQGDVRSAQTSFQRAVSEGRLVVQSRQDVALGGRAALVAAGHSGTENEAATSAGVPEDAVETSSTIPVEAPPADPEVAWRHTRLAITAGLVVLLLVVWIWQKRAGR